MFFHDPDESERSMNAIEHLNPDGMHRNPAFSQGIVVEGPRRTVYVGGQNAVAGDGSIVGEGDVAAQSAQAARNVATVLTAAGATIDDVVQMTVYIIHGQPLGAAFAAFQKEWGRAQNPPTISVVQVAGLAHPAFLVEVSAVAEVSTR